MTPIEPTVKAAAPPFKNSLGGYLANVSYCFVKADKWLSVNKKQSA
jgi:hypothetical protein